MNPPPKVGIIMGSQSDWPVLSSAQSILEQLEVPHESRIVSAHRTPDRMYRYAREAEERRLAHLEQLRKDEFCIRSKRR